MNVFRKWNNWLTDDYLRHHYPILTAFDRTEALKRLQAYEHEEREAGKPWTTIGSVLNIAATILWVVMWMHWSERAAAFIVALQIPGTIFQFWFRRRIKRRVQAKAEAELDDGRLWTCVECGYDLRASSESCPECGAPVHVVPPAKGT